MINERIVTPGTNSPLHRISWSAILAGAFVGLGLAFLLHLYAIAISLSAFSSASNHGASVITIGGLLGMIIGVIAAMATAGFVAGYLGRFHYYLLHGGVIYGFLTWSIIIFLSAIMVGPMESYVENFGNSLSNSTVIRNNGEDRNVTVQNTAVVPKNGKMANVPVVDVSAKQLAFGGWVVFVLFFVGALSSCIGACYGIQCKRDYPNLSNQP
jgi:hypothetical protein